MRKLLRLENWATLETSPGNAKLVGNVYGVSEGSKLKEGQSIMTSYIKNMDLAKRVAYTQNSTYHLGKPMEASALGGCEGLLKNVQAAVNPLPESFAGELRANVRTMG